MQATCSGLDWMSCIAHIGYPICGWPKLIKKNVSSWLAKYLKGNHTEDSSWPEKLCTHFLSVCFFWFCQYKGCERKNFSALNWSSLLWPCWFTHYQWKVDSWLNCDQVCQICWPCLWHHWHRLLSTNWQHLWSHFPWLSNINSLTNRMRNSVIIFFFLNAAV